MKDVKKTYTLSNGITTPSIGYGTWRTKPADFAYDCVKMAIEVGYRHIDCAAVYKNEAGVGKALSESKTPRNELFITSKIWCADRGYDKTIAAFEKTTRDLMTDYLDCYIIHWPSNHWYSEDYEEENRQTWLALEDLYKDKKVRSIGLSNHKPHQVKSILKIAKIPPMVNQIEIHPGWPQLEGVKFFQENDILVEAWSPLGSGSVLENKTILDIAASHQKNPGQICVRWLLERGILPLPKSTNRERALSNMDVFDFSLTEEETEKLNSLPVLGYSGLDSDEVYFDH